ncbi:BCNT-domain-containing protein [Myriangium duriaei CBS 260.36]|uniref:SWR1-complex protein 5 n=1 Tax=Myriangium duriaei CBS 260.36 TaxID=1168546 RepID=A0A9P4MCK7_9PEZI|nr:BCNT-domain-containing protein [Myriangium duriaei CBS 260.36]
MEEDEKDYIESEDEDFNPDANENDDQNFSSSSDDEDGEKVAKKTKKPARKRKPEPEDDLDSGDEVTIQEAKRKKRRKDKADDDESGGEGGLIKTRAQRAAEKEERREYRRTHKGEVTIDVNALWTSLSSVPIGRRQNETQAAADQTDTVLDQNGAAEDLPDSDRPKDLAEDAHDDEYITIKREYEFAGQTVSEEKRVHRDSAEAKLFLSKANDNGPDEQTLKTREDGLTLRRPLKRPSMFEPNPTGEVKGLPLHKQRLRTPSRADVLAQQKRVEEEIKANGGKAQRLNTVQKSAIDWASHVDAEGLKDELAEYDRSKQGYMSKMDFLQGVQGRRDEEERRARLQKV